MSSIGAISAGTTSGMTGGGPGGAKSVIEATLAEIEKQKAILARPLNMPDMRYLYRIGTTIDFSI